MSARPCWPARGVEAYRRAAELGSSTAREKLDDLLRSQDSRLQPCA